MIQKIFVTGLTLKNTLLFSALLCLLSACWDDNASAPVPAPSKGEVFRDVLKDGGEGPEMVVLPTGSFSMGSPPTEAGRDSDEGPVRTVTISKRIAMGRYEVTFADYDRFVLDTYADIPDDEGWGRGMRPVVNVSQEDAQAYAKWLSAQTGKRYRLPTEAEWEYAARAGTTTRYSWGDDIGRNRANCAGCGSEWGNKKTAPVGSFAANAFGLHDMHGNVLEWVADCHGDYADAPTDGSARTGCDEADAVLRSGSWILVPLWVRSAGRSYSRPSDRIDSSGFRLVQDINHGSASDDAAPNPVPFEVEVFRDALKDGGEGPEMVVLPTGSFSMGSPPTEAGRDSDEEPVRTVTISKRIAMGRYEVTFAEYDRFANATAGVDRPSDSGWGRGTRPVINVSRHEAKAYAAWLSAQTGKRYRLPSEAEWEYAARAGTTTKYSWGDSITCKQARYGRRPDTHGFKFIHGECSKSLDGPVAVGSFAANPFGLYDMHGNVAELVEDCPHFSYEGAPTDGSAWTTGCEELWVFVRGGSWYTNQDRMRSANRAWVRPPYRGYRYALRARLAKLFPWWVRPPYRGDTFGFRLVQDINP